MKKRFKKCKSIVLAFVMALSLAGFTPAFASSLSPYQMPEVWTGESADAFGGGTGTEADAYQISTAEQLAYLAAQVNSGNDYSGKYFQLTKDIVLNTYDGYDWEYGGIVDDAEDLLNENNSEDDYLPFQWTPIGDTATYFQGSFNGNNHVVSGLLIEQDAENSANGLFGVIGTSGTVEKLGIVNLYIDTSTVESGATGAVTGYNLGQIEACYSVGGTIEGYKTIGGIAGYNGGNLYDCHNACDLQIGNNTEDFNLIGGITGISGAGEIEGCYNTGVVYGSGFSVGGILGHSEGDTDATLITACYNTGAVTGYGNYVGGIAGYFNHGTLDSCSNSGAVNGEDLDIGGIVGYAHGNSYDVSILNCSNSGEVTGPDEAIGGIVGHLDEVEGGSCTVQYCYNAGAVSGPVWATRIGGVAGKVEGTPSVADCYYDTDVCDAVGGAIGGDVASEDDDTNNVIGKTTADMQTDIGLTGWDTWEIWYFDFSEYPELMPLDTNNPSQLSIAYADVWTDDADLYFASSEAGTCTYSVEDSEGNIVDEDDSGNLSATTGMNLLEIDDLAPATTYIADVEIETTVGNIRTILIEFTTADLSATLTPASELMEGNLDTNSLSVTLAGDGFWDETLDKANFTLNNGPSGLTVESLDFTDWTHCTINLAFDGTDFSADVTNFSVTIAGEELDSDSPLTSNTLTIATTREWTIVGTAGFSSGTAMYISSAADSSGTPYVAYSDWGNDKKASVKKLNAAGTSWELVGADGFSAGQADNVCLAIDSNDTLYAAYVDMANSTKATVMKYDGTSWEAVGSVGFTVETASRLSLALDSNNVPYVAYAYADGNDQKVKVCQYNSVSSAWDIVGGGGFSAATGAETTMFIQDFDFGIDGTTPYIAYSGMWGGNGNIRPVVMTYNETDWVVVGANVIADVNALAIDLVVDSDGNPCAAYMEGGGAIKLWRYSESAWNNLSSASTYTGYTTGATVSLAVDGNELYISIPGFENSYNKKATVVKFNDLISSVIGDAKFTAGDASYQSLVVGANKTPYLAFQDGANGDKLTVMGYLPVTVNALTGTATISGSAVSGQTLTASLVGGNNTGELSYQWTRNGTDISGVTASTYKLVQADVGAVIAVKITSSVETGTLISSATGTVTAPQSSGDYSVPDNSDVAINIGGKSATVGTKETKTNSEGQSTTTVTVDADKMERILDSSEKGATVTIPVSGSSDVAQGVLNGKTIKSMEEKEAVLVVLTNSASYALPASEIDIDAVSKQLGTDISLADINVTVSIAEPSDAMAKVIESTAKDGGFTIAVPAVEYTITCEHSGKTVEVSSFNSYVERTIAIPDGVDPSKITTGIVVDPDGTVHHVPTRITQIDGKYYAIINSLTNSTYSVIWNPVEFADAANHWAKDSINNMGSRMIVTGTGDGNYDPDRDITRAEFATIMVRALGLEPGTGASGFSDVNTSDWFCGYVETASEYGLITGYPDGAFGPNDTITREQAMAIVARAMKITKLETALTADGVGTLLAGFADGASVSAYAKESIAACVSAGIVSGRTGKTIAPVDSITRSEVAVIVERLLQKSELI